jgi:hypothetical protein
MKITILKHPSTNLVTLVKLLAPFFPPEAQGEFQKIADFYERIRNSTDFVNALKNHYFKAPFNKSGYFGKVVSAFLPPEVQGEFQNIADFYERIRNSTDFVNELKYIRQHFRGRSTPISFCKNLTAQYEGAQIYLKRET